MTNNSFAGLGASNALVAILAERGVTDPWPFQAAAISDVLAGADVQVTAASGKALTFSLAVVMKITPSDDHPTGLVLVPNSARRDFVVSELELLGEPNQISVVGWADSSPDEIPLADIVVATPERLATVLEGGGVSFANVRLVVFDEADQLADLAPQLDAALQEIDAEYQSMVLSAGSGGAVTQIVQRYLRDPVHHQAQGDSAVSDSVEVGLIEVRYLPKESEATNSLVVLRREWWRLLILMVSVFTLVNVLALMRGPGDERYHAQALVVASQDMEGRIDTFTRTAVGIFSAGSVAELAAEYSDTNTLPADLIPGIVTISPVEDSAVLEVDAIHSNPELAARYANATSRALSEELNRLATLVGSSTAHVEAIVPIAPIPQSRWPGVIASIVCALFITGGAVWVLLVGRDPNWSKSFRRWRRIVFAGSARASDQKLSAQNEAAAVSLQSDDVGPPPGGLPGAISTSETLATLEPLVAPLEQLGRPSPLHPLIEVNEAVVHALEAIDGVDALFAGRLVAAGITTIEGMANADWKWLADAIEVRRDVALAWVSYATVLVEAKQAASQETDERQENSSLDDPSAGAPVSELVTPHDSEPPVPARVAQVPHDIAVEPERSDPLDPAPSADLHAVVALSSESALASETAPDANAQLTMSEPRLPFRHDLQLRSVKGIGAVYAARLTEAGVADLNDLKVANPHILALDLGLRYGVVAEWVSQARQLTGESESEADGKP